MGSLGHVPGEARSKVVGASCRRSCFRKPSLTRRDSLPPAFFRSSGDCRGTCATPRSVNPFPFPLGIPEENFGAEQQELRWGNPRLIAVQLPPVPTAIEVAVILMCEMAGTQRRQSRVGSCQRVLFICEGGFDLSREERNGFPVLGAHSRESGSREMRGSRDQGDENDKPNQLK